ncbi:MAG: acyl transferase [Bacteroidota bacterium]
MDVYKSIQQKLFQVTENNFESFTLDLFRYQAINNPIYAEYINNLSLSIDNVKSLSQIPFIPISFFKDHKIRSAEWETEAIFESSGTTQGNASKHYIRDLSLYDRSAIEAFNGFYGDLSNYHFLALLPSYLERNNSSLIRMVDVFIQKSGSSLGGFYLDNLDDLIANLGDARKTDRKVFLIGVSFALLDLAEHSQIDLSDAIVMETGGMKGRRKEITRQELHNKLNDAFGTSQIHSEYGMTELLSQAYSKGGGYFQASRLMKVILRDLNDPFDMQIPVGKTGGINVIDLANISSCAFIETQDIGRIDDRGLFEVLGRFDNSDIRGCNLMFG